MKIISKIKNLVKRLTKKNTKTFLGPLTETYIYIRKFRTAKLGGAYIEACSEAKAFVPH